MEKLAADSPESPRSTEERIDAAVRARTSELTGINLRLSAELAVHRDAAASAQEQHTALDQRVSELQALFDVIPVGIGIAGDADCSVVRTNRAFANILGLAPEENASFESANYVVEKDGIVLRMEDLPMRQAVKRNAPVRDFEETIVRADGTRVEIIVNTVPIRDAAGNVCGCIGTYQDITTHQKIAVERLAAYRRLQETHKLESIGVLAGGVAHDFNNLLTAILGYAHLLHLEVPEKKNAQNMLMRIESSAQQAADLCRQLLAYAGKGNYAMRSRSLNEIIANAGATFDGPRPEINVRFDLAQELPTIRGDAAQIRQMVANLFTNAVEAMEGRRGEIVIRTGVTFVAPSRLKDFATGHSLKAGQCVFVEVSDEGTGMGPDALGKIFEPFFSTKFIGRGLGLPAVLGIIHGHRGAAEVISESGKGTTVRLYLPVESAASVGPSTNFPRPATLAAEPPPQNSILVVDDEPAIRDFAAAVLNRAGFVPILAADGEEAVGLMREQSTTIAAAMIDLTMPKLNGEDTLKMLREINPRLPAIMVSGYSESMVSERFAGTPLLDFLAKPFPAELAVGRLRAVMLRAQSVAPAA